MRTRSDAGNGFTVRRRKFRRRKCHGERPRAGQGEHGPRAFPRRAFACGGCIGPKLSRWILGFGKQAEARLPRLRIAWVQLASGESRPNAVARAHGLGFAAAGRALGRIAARSAGNGAQRRAARPVGSAGCGAGAPAGACSARAGAGKRPIEVRPDMVARHGRLGEWEAGRRVRPAQSRYRPRKRHGLRAPHEVYLARRPAAFDAHIVLYTNSAPQKLERQRWPTGAAGASRASARRVGDGDVAGAFSALYLFGRKFLTSDQSLGSIGFVRRAKS
jgi:hypothetical protein